MRTQGLCAIIISQSEFSNLKLYKGNFGYHWLPLATIDLVGGNREFDVFRHILSSYTHYNWFTVLDLQSFITICPWLPLVAPSNH